MGKSTISMAIFNSYVSLPEGSSSLQTLFLKPPGTLWVKTRDWWWSNALATEMGGTIQIRYYQIITTSWFSP